MKKANLIITILICILAISAPIAAFADVQDTSVMYTTSSEGSLPGNYSGNTDDIFSLKNPQELVTTSTTKSYVVSGIAQTDSVVSLYAYNSETGNYDRIYTDDGVLMETKVGASGLFAQSVNLNPGKNSFMIVATKGTGTEVIKLEITLDQNLFTKIINLGADLSQLFIR